MKYTIPYSYTVTATIEIEASALHSAVGLVERLAKVNEDGSCRLIHGFSPVTNAKIDLKSIKVDMEEAEELNPKKTYEVIIKRTQTMSVMVEAHSDDDACDIANAQYDDGEFDESDFEDEEVETLDPTVCGD
jgi:hypothetical protein